MRAIRRLEKARVEPPPESALRRLDFNALTGIGIACLIGSLMWAGVFWLLWKAAL